MAREIYTQGHFDGACFLYSICNSYNALTASSVTQARWNKLMPAVPFSQDFMYGRGTNGIEDNILDCTISNFLNDISDKHAFTVIRGNEQALMEALDKGSASVFAVKDLDHWVCGVGTADNKILVACSLIGYNKNPKKDAVINACPKTGRLYNRLLSKEAIVDGSIFLITLTK
jgi:hypothetical protein